MLLLITKMADIKKRAQIDYALFNFYNVMKFKLPD